MVSQRQSTLYTESKNVYYKFKIKDQLNFYLNHNKEIVTVRLRNVRLLN